MNAKDLVDSYGRRIKNYFAHKPIDLLYPKLEKLCEEDPEKQCGYIELAMEMMTDSPEQFMNKVYCSKEYNIIKKDKASKTAQLKQNIELLTERVLRNAIWKHEYNEVSWHTVQFSNENRKNWTIRPMNMYLYDGLAGMLLLMYSLRWSNRKTEINEIYEILKKQMFQYTDSGVQSLENLKTRNTGIYEGEGSYYIYVSAVISRGGRRRISGLCAETFRNPGATH